MKRPVKSYAQRSAAHLVPQDHLWERSMRQLIRDNFDLIESDIRRIGAVNIIRHLENERDELFNAFLDEQEQKARARLERSADDVDARRALEAIDHARTHRPYEAIKTHSFEQTLSVERKERRAAGTYHHTKPHRSKPTNTTSAHIAALKQFGRPESRAPRPLTAKQASPMTGLPSTSPHRTPSQPPRIRRGFSYLQRRRISVGQTTPPTRTLRPPRSRLLCRKDPLARSRAAPMPPRGQVLIQPETRRSARRQMLTRTKRRRSASGECPFQTEPTGEYHVDQAAHRRRPAGQRAHPRLECRRQTWP